MRVLPFTGTRYSSRKVEPTDLAAPPFDQIDPDRQSSLHQTPHQFAHLTRPAGTSVSDAHRNAVATHSHWLKNEIVERESTPSLYPYSIDIESGGVRHGICALFGLEEPDSGIIRPHEQTVAKTVEERVALLAETQIDLEPVLLLADDNGSLESLLAADTSESAPLVTHEDEFGNIHRLYRLDDPSRIGDYQNALRPCSALIADGHHRCQVARTYAETISDPTGAQTMKLAVITSLESPGVRIDPIHRALRSAPDLGAAAKLVSDRTQLSARSGREIAQAVASVGEPALAVWRQGDRPEIWRLDASLEVGRFPAAAGRLAVLQLHENLLPALGFPESATRDGTILYRSDPDTLFSEIESGDLALGIWLPPMNPENFSAAIADGSLMPPKSTRFLPKLVSGMVWAEHGIATR